MHVEEVAMRRISIALAGIVWSVAAWAQAPDSGQVFDFEDQQPGPATVCEAGLTGGGGAVDWEIVEDADSPGGPRVLAEMSGDSTNNRFPLCVFPGVGARDVDVTVAFKPVAGRIDQAAGIAVRLRDEDNYYIARANALEGNVRFYIVEGGVRRQLAGVDVAVPGQQWQTLGLRVSGTTAEVSLNGQGLFNFTEVTALEDATGVAVWTKADSLTHFDNVTILAAN
jgi:hypothetical protein